MTNLVVSSSFVSTRRSQWSSASLRLLSNFQIGYSLSSEHPTGVPKVQKAPEPCSNFLRIDSKVVVAPFEVCQGSARGCVALGVQVAVVEVASAAIGQSLKPTFLHHFPISVIHVLALIQKDEQPPRSDSVAANVYWSRCSKNSPYRSLINRVIKFHALLAAVGA